MVKSEVVQARVSAELKADAERIFQEIGLDMASAIRIFLQRVQREGDFPFDLRMFNDETIKTIQRAARGRRISKPYSDAHSMMQDILGPSYA